MKNDLLEYFTEISKNIDSHIKTEKKYINLSEKLSNFIKDTYDGEQSPTFHIGENLSFKLPFHNMGNINTTHLFGMDEVIILTFYYLARNRYKNILDLGANIGLHSIVLNLLGYNVHCYEADPETFSVLQNNLHLNDCKNVRAINSAAANFDGVAEFTRVCGNLTGSHLTGAKKDPYGELEKFSVNVVDIGKIVHQFDLVKIDIEGLEADVLCSVPTEIANNIDFMLEINGIENAKRIFDYTKNAGLDIFLQKNGWNKVSTFDELPLSHKDGSVFISTKPPLWSFL